LLTIGIGGDTEEAVFLEESQVLRYIGGGSEDPSGEALSLMTVKVESSTLVYHQGSERG